MKQYTQEEALTEIFSKNKSLRVEKHRYKNNILAQKTIDTILKNNGFKIIQATIYAKI